MHRRRRRAGAAARLHALAVRPPLLQAVVLLARGEQLRAVLDAPARERGERGQQVARPAGESSYPTRAGTRAKTWRSISPSRSSWRSVALSIRRETPSIWRSSSLKRLRAGVEAREHDDAPLGGQHADGGLQRLEVLAVDARGRVRSERSCRSMNVGSPDPVSRTSDTMPPMPVPERPVLVAPDSFKGTFRAAAGRRARSAAGSSAPG